jgi:deoxycytidylate deaminase
MDENTIAYPYIPDGKSIAYVTEDDGYMQEAQSEALEHSLDVAVKTGAVVVRGAQIIGRGANGSDYHKTHECERVKQGIPTGQGYELCEGCSPKNHAEPKAIADALSHGADTQGADLYLWGHWWCCEPCWNTMVGAGISNVYLLRGSEVLFNKSNPNNILGKW